MSPAPADQPPENFLAASQPADTKVFADPSLQNIRIPYTCPAGSAGGCQGTLSLYANTASRVVHRVLIGEAALNLLPGETKLVAVSINEAGRRVIGQATSSAKGGVLDGAVLVTPVASIIRPDGSIETVTLPTVSLKVLRRLPARSVSLAVKALTAGVGRRRYLVSGTVWLPRYTSRGAQILRSDACGFGHIGVRWQSKGTTVSYRIVQLRDDCTYRSVVSFGLAARFRTRFVTVRTEFFGNQFVLQQHSRRRTLRTPF